MRPARLLSAARPPPHQHVCTGARRQGAATAKLRARSPLQAPEQAPCPPPWTERGRQKSEHARGRSAGARLARRPAAAPRVACRGRGSSATRCRSPASSSASAVSCPDAAERSSARRSAIHDSARASAHLVILQHLSRTTCEGQAAPSRVLASQQPGTRWHGSASCSADDNSAPAVTLHAS